MYKKIAIQLIKKLGKKVDDHYEINDIWVSFEKNDLYISDSFSSGNISYMDFINLIIKRWRDNNVVIKKN
jgi:hypothetical protein